VGIVGEDRVEDRVGDLVGDLVGVPFGDRLGGERERARADPGTLAAAYRPGTATRPWDGGPSARRRDRRVTRPRGRVRRSRRAGARRGGGGRASTGQAPW